MPKLICLMPTYNKENTLAKAIESVLMQKTDFEYTLIILDDCSTDKSNEIANEYLKKYPDKIKIVRNETNLKLLKSIINGYKLLKGADYFCVLDADDWYTYDRKFQEAVNFLEKNKDYSMYMTNILQKSKDREEICYPGNEESIDFDFNDRKCGICIFIQTSGVVYRNLYFKTGQNKKFENVLNYKFPQSFRADGFRFEWYLQKGKAHFTNKAESVYNYDEQGIWSSTTESEQILNNAKLMYSCAEFFNEEKSFYLNQAKYLYKKSMKRFKTEEETVFARNKDLIIELFECLYPKRKESKIKKFLIKIMPKSLIKRRLTYEMNLNKE